MNLIPSTGKINEIIDKLEIPLAGFGFLHGVTAGASYPPTAQGYRQRLVDMLAQTVGYIPTLPAPWPNSNKTPKFKLTGFLNKGLIALALIEFYSALDLPFHALMKKIGTPIAAGYTIGGFFDPPDGGYSYTPQASHSGSSHDWASLRAITQR